MATDGAAVHPKNGNRAPLLLMANGKDDTAPAAVTKTGLLCAPSRARRPVSKVALGFVLLCGVAITVVASVVRQVFAVELYRASAADVSLAAA